MTLAAYNILYPSIKKFHHFVTSPIAKNCPSDENARHEIALGLMFLLLFGFELPNEDIPEEEEGSVMAMGISPASGLTLARPLLSHCVLAAARGDAPSDEAPEAPPPPPPPPRYEFPGVRAAACAENVPVDPKVPESPEGKPLDPCCC